MSSLNRYTWIVANILFDYHFITSMEEVTISTKQGRMKGVTLSSRNGTEYNAFYSIPYAKPPVGELRFEPPQEPDTWNDVRDATNQSIPCLHILGNDGKTGQEDCLYLNVFTPYKWASQTSSLLPTIVYIHGGGNVYGCPAINDPVYLMDNPVVIVNFQFRLNVLGFLSAGDEILPGNYGMKDQVAVLKWVKNNIDDFGGDANRVTLVGNSSGATDVHLHMYSPLSKGLFQRAISQSGSALAPWMVISSEEAQNKAREYAVLSGCMFTPTSSFVKCLQTISEDQLIFNHEKLKIEYASTKPFPVVIESKKSKDAFLIENPWLQNAVSQVPWIIGVNADEGSYKALEILTCHEKIENLQINYPLLFPRIFAYEWMSAEMSSETSEKLKQFYFDNEPISKKPEKLVQLFSDSYVVFDCIEAARRYNGERYFYLYDHRNSYSFMDVLGKYGNVNEGVCHADELISFFYMSFFPIVTNGPDLEVSERLIKYWINFVSNGNPNGEKEIWQPVKSNELEYLHIKTKEDVMEKVLWPKRINFLKSLPIFKRYGINGKQTNGTN